MPGPDTSVTCHWHGHVYHTERCRCQAHAAHTQLTHVARTLIDKHITYKGGQPSTDGDTYTSHTKTQGQAALGTHRQGRPPAQMHWATQEYQCFTKTPTRHRQAPQTKIHADTRVTCSGTQSPTDIPKTREQQRIRWTQISQSTVVPITYGRAYHRTHTARCTHMPHNLTYVTTWTHVYPDTMCSSLTSLSGTHTSHTQMHRDTHH